MEKRFRIVALIVSIVSLFMLSNCDAVDAITGSESDDPLIETPIEITTLHPVLLNGEWGYINNKGEITIAPDYDEARDFSDGWAAVRIGTEWGYVKHLLQNWKSRLIFVLLVIFPMVWLQLNFQMDYMAS